MSKPLKFTNKWVVTRLGYVLNVQVIESLYAYHNAEADPTRRQLVHSAFGYQDTIDKDRGLVHDTPEQALLALIKSREIQLTTAEAQVRVAEALLREAREAWHAEAFNGGNCGHTWCIVCNPQFISER